MIESWNFQHLFEIEFCGTSQNFNSFSSFRQLLFSYFLSVVWLSRNFVRFHKIFNLEKQKVLSLKKYLYFIKQNFLYYFAHNCSLKLYIPFKNCRKNTGSKSRYFFIYQNRISNKLRTKNINVIGSCCWKICPRIGFGRCQALKPGDKKKPNVSYISRIQAYNC